VFVKFGTISVEEKMDHASLGEFRCVI